MLSFLLWYLLQMLRMLLIITGVFIHIKSGMFQGPHSIVVSLAGARLPCQSGLGGVLLRHHRPWLLPINSALPPDTDIESRALLFDSWGCHEGFGFTFPWEAGDSYGWGSGPLPAALYASFPLICGSGVPANYSVSWFPVFFLFLGESCPLLFWLFSFMDLRKTNASKPFSYLRS